MIRAVLTAFLVLLVFPNAKAEGPAMTAKVAAAQFFDRYREQNVPAMIDLFEPKGTVEYVPFGLKGPVEDIGPGSWGVLIASFPDLSNRVNTIWEGEDGRSAFVDVNISGTQQKEAFGVQSKGKSYDLRHLFIIRTNEAGKIISILAFWDNADWYRQLGKTSLD